MTGPVRPLGPLPSSDLILGMWREGLDTLDIARATLTPESDIARMLPRILELDRQDQEWNFDRIANPGVRV